MVRADRKHLFFADRLRQSHNILIFHSITMLDPAFDHLCCCKIYQTMSGDIFCQTVPCNRQHAICHNTAILCNGNIACARTDIDQGNIQHPVHLRNRHCHGSDRLQCQIGNLKPCQLHCLIKPVHNIIRQKGRDQIRCDDLCLVIFQIAHRIMIHIIAHDRIANAVKLHIQLIFLLELFIRLFNAIGIQCKNVFFCNELFTFQIDLHRSRHSL